MRTADDEKNPGLKNPPNLSTRKSKTKQKKRQKGQVYGFNPAFVSPMWSIVFHPVFLSTMWNNSYYVEMASVSVLCG